MGTKYSVKKLEEFELDQYFPFFKSVARKVWLMYGKKFRYERFRIRSFTDCHHLVICLRDAEPVGVLLYRLYPSIFDDETRIVYQDLLYAEPGTRAAYHLLHHLIDFTRHNADHLIVMTTPYANIKGESLERLGFKKLETLYRLEV